jgi:mycothiol synthase
MKTLQAPWIKLKEHLDLEDYNQISELQQICSQTDGITLKLELDYKLAAATDNNSVKPGINNINEFMCFDGKQLVGYIGICCFPGAGMQLEITGMVHPDYRRLGVFTRLNELVLAECRKRHSNNILILCDKKSAGGQSFIKKLGAAVYKNSEYEMYLQQEDPEPEEKLLCGIKFKKAVNSDAYEIARQNEIYFGDDHPDDEEASKNNLLLPDDEEALKNDLLLPEEEEKRGMVIYLAIKDDKIIGKVHLETNPTVSGIYGLGILPEYRGRGYGRAVLLMAVKKLKEEKARNIMLQVAAENATALKLYKSCGFMETSTMDYFELNINA